MSRLVSALRAFRTDLPNRNPGLTAGAISCRPFGPRLAALPAITLCLLAITRASATEPEIRLVEKDNVPVAVEVAGLPADHLAALAKLPAEHELWARTLSVYVGKHAQAGQPPVSGTFAVRKEVLRFTPQFPLRAGLAYRAEVFLPAPSRDTAPSRYEQLIELAAPPAGEPARVTAVFPSAATLPENQLRFYLHFATPMGRGEAYDHLLLLKPDGRPVHRPFLEIGEELWDTSGTRLTLLVDPGRIKRGLSPREQFGPVLEAGGKYTLVVTKGWRDAADQQLAEDFKKSFTAGPPIETAVDHKVWKITSPAGATQQPLVVNFPLSLDRALVERTITVADAAGKRVAGDVVVGKEERLWQFTPDRPWTAGKHELVIDTTLEDLAGNRINRPFEVDEFREIDKSALPECVRLPFEIRPAGK